MLTNLYRITLFIPVFSMLMACGFSEDDDDYPDISMEGMWQGHFSSSGYFNGTISNSLDIEITSQSGAYFSGKWKYSNGSYMSGFTVTGFLESNPAGNWVTFDFATGKGKDCVNFYSEPDSYSFSSSTADPNNYSDGDARHYTNTSCYVAVGSMTISRL